MNEPDPAAVSFAIETATAAALDFHLARISDHLQIIAEGLSEIVDHLERKR